MLSMLRRAVCAVALVSPLLACHAQLGMNRALPEPVPGYVTDVPAFERFIALRPTPEEFRRVYPDVTLVLPGQIATKELRLNNSRYFAELDEDGRIIGGRFQ